MRQGYRPSDPQAIALTSRCDLFATERTVGTHYIRIRVDRTTLRQWAAALTPLRRRYVVPVVSVGDVSGLPPIPGAIGFTGLKLLQEVGLATTRPNVLDDPARHFALLKYATSLADTDKFALHREAKHIDAHKKRVASDEFGCGFAFLFARRVLEVKHFLDLRTAVNDGLVQLPTALSKQPDYIASGRDRTKLVALEAKGTQSGAGDSRRQVLSGCKQVAACAVAYPSYSIVSRVAIGVSLNREEQRVSTTVHVSDPPPEPAPTLTFSEDIKTALVESHYSRAALLAGDDDLAVALRRRGERRPDASLEAETAGNRKFRGSRLILHTTDSRSSIELFVGVDDEVRRALMERDIDSALALADSTEAEVTYSPERSRQLHVWNSVQLYSPDLASRLATEPELVPGTVPELARAHVPLLIGEGQSAPEAKQPRRERRAQPPWHKLAEPVSEDPSVPAAASGGDGTWLELRFSGEAAEEIRQVEATRPSSSSV
jgi:hypothetical protein